MGSKVQFSPTARGARRVLKRRLTATTRRYNDLIPGIDLIQVEIGADGWQRSPFRAEFAVVADRRIKARIELGNRRSAQHAVGDFGEGRRFEPFAIVGIQVEVARSVEGKAHYRAGCMKAPFTRTIAVVRKIVVIARKLNRT